MKIVVITGTPQKGISYFMKEEFMKHLRDGNEVTEFYPDDMPSFCLGCKNCFLLGEKNCPHIGAIGPLWQAFLQADLLVFAYPVYALRAPASIKSLLDHMCVHWMVHRPDPGFFSKRAVILTNSVGAPNGSAQNDVKTSMAWMGVSSVYTCGMPMMGDIFIDKLTSEHRKKIEEKMKKLAYKVKDCKPVSYMSLKVWFLFAIAKLEHIMILKGESVPSLDTQHYLDHGWIKR